MDELLTVFGPARVLGVPQIVFGCLVSFVLCSAIATTYRWTYQGLSYSRSFVHALILGGVITCILIMAIGNNLARGLGILGTLAIIRFRTQIRDPRDIMFLFISLAVGIAAGAAVFPVAVTGTIFFCLVALYLHWSPFASRREFEGLLRFVAPASMPETTEQAIHQAMKHCCQSYQLVAMREAAQGNLIEHSYHVRLMDPSYHATLVEELHGVENVTDASLLMHRSTVEL